MGIREVDDQVWQVSFLEHDPGYFDRDQDRDATPCINETVICGSGNRRLCGELRAHIAAQCRRRTTDRRQRDRRVVGIQ